MLIVYIIRGRIVNKKNVWIAVVMGAVLLGLFTACAEKIAQVDTFGLRPALTTAGTGANPDLAGLWRAGWAPVRC